MEKEKQKETLLSVHEKLAHIQIRAGDSHEMSRILDAIGAVHNAIATELKPVEEKK